MSSKDSEDPSTKEVLVTEVTELVSPICYAGERAADGDTEPLVQLLIRANLDDIPDRTFEAMVDVIGGLGSAWAPIEDLVVDKDGQLDPDEIVEAVEGIGEIISTISELDDLPVPETSDIDSIGGDLFSYLAVSHLDRNHPQLYNTLAMLAIIDETGSRPTLHLDRVGDLTSSPQQFAGETYGWGTDQFEFRTIIRYFQDLLSARGAATTLTVSTLLPSLMRSRPEDDALELTVPVVVLHQPDSAGSAGLKFLEFPPGEDSNALPGIALVIYGNASFSKQFRLGDDWMLETNLESLQQALGVGIRPDRSGSVSVSALPETPSGGTTIEAEGSLSYDPESEDTSEMVLIGAAGGTRLALDSLSASIGVTFSGGDLELTAALPASANIFIQPQGGFLKKILPPKGITGGFTVEVGWANTRGVYFDGSAKLSTTIPINESIGKKGAKLELVSVYLALEVGGDEADVRLTGAVTANAQLGPIAGTVREMGVHGDVTFPEDRDGNLGPMDFTAEFNPPTGAGLSLDSPGVSGGGFLGYDEANERYSAIFSLTVGPVQVKVFGLLATEMPDGSEGFSLLISIYGEFPPVQLSFGFTLNGLGGVIGVNRALMTKPLRKAARTGKLNNVLFPDNPAAHPTQLVSDLRSIYPVTRDQHVFGPMARFGWGTPNQIQLDIGIVLQLPKFKIAVLGIFRVGLPSIEMPKLAQQVRLNLSVAGTVDPQKKLVAVAAALYDSRLVQWTVKGSMAMRLRWGDRPEFLFAVGGFHEKFKPPESFPTVKSLTVSLAIPGGNPTVQWRGYFAVTSNTVQVGSSLKARFTAGPVKAKGWWSFDALFQFKPLKFVIKLAAGLEVKVKGFTLSVTLKGSMKGPAPTHIRGKLSVDLPGPLPDPSPKVHFTLGEETSSADSLPTADVLTELSTQVEKPANWAAQLPKGGEDLVSLRDVEVGETEVLAHPQGRLSVRQTTVPLKERVEKFGENRPIHREFDLAIATESGGSLPTMGDTTESFAPAKYERMSDSEKLNAPSFTDMTAGREAAGDLLHWGCEVASDDGQPEEKPENATSAELLYEPSREEPFPNEDLEAKVELPQPDGGSRADDGQRPAYPPAVTRSLADDGSVANAEHRHTGDGKFRPDGPQYDPVEYRSNVGIGGPFVVVRDPTILDRVDHADVAGTGGGSS